MTYAEFCSGWDAEFARNRELHGARIQCRAGCSDCCGQIFQITEVEAEVIARGVDGLDPELRAALQEKARAYLVERARLTARDGRPEAWGDPPPVGARLPCPALVDGACAIYEHRPLICRRFGIPLWNPDQPGRVMACELNFKPGEAIDDGELIQIHTELHYAWKQHQAAYNAAGGWRDESPLSVARALLK